MSPPPTRCDCSLNGPAPTNRGSRWTGRIAATVVGIVRRLDGIPLALELAAARLRSLTVGDIAARLDHRFRLLTTGNRVAVARQQTLRAAMDWSYDLLNETERTVLCRASVFAGGFDLAAAEAIVADADTVGLIDVVDVIDALVDKSLIHYDPTVAATSRYKLLESIRDYAAEHLATAGLDAVDVCDGPPRPLPDRG